MQQCLAESDMIYRHIFLPSCLNVGIFDRAKISGQTAVRHRRIVARFAFSLYFDPPPFQVNARHTLRLLKEMNYSNIKSRGNNQTGVDRDKPRNLEFRL